MDHKYFLTDDFTLKTVMNLAAFHNKLMILI